ncbi:MAG: hypothetical protein JWM32_3115 [Verrucomicrobia bacterium]|nr:hypothetical protein [Verrucomicrobiota bacterium]
MKEDIQQEVRVVIDVSLTLSTKHDAPKVRQIIERGLTRMFPNNYKHFNAAKFAEEQAIYGPGAILWQTIHAPVNEPHPTRQPARIVDTQCSSLNQLRFHEDRSSTLRAKLGIRPPGDIIAKYWVTDDKDLIVVADGDGAATVEEIEGNYPVDYHINHSREFATEKEAYDFAYRLDNDQASWDDESVPDQPAPLSSAMEEIPTEPAAAVREPGQLYAPNGKQIIATKDWIPGNALIQGATRAADGSLEIEWAGETKVCWDGQYTEQVNGRMTYLDEDANEWREDQLTLAE